MKKIYKFRAGVWLWPGVGGWHFVNVPEKISNEIREKYGKGMVKVVVKVGNTKWGTSLFPYRNPKGDFGYLISIKKIVRKKEEISEGDIIELSFKIS